MLFGLKIGYEKEKRWMRIGSYILCSCAYALHPVGFPGSRTTGVLSSATDGSDPLQMSGHCHVPKVHQLFTWGQWPLDPQSMSEVRPAVLRNDPRRKGIARDPQLHRETGAELSLGETDWASSSIGKAAWPLHRQVAYA